MLFNVLYLDYRPLRPDDPTVEDLLGCPESSWITRDLEEKALTHAIAEVVPEHLKEVRNRRSAWIRFILERENASTAGH